VKEQESRDKYLNCKGKIIMVKYRKIPEERRNINYG